MKKILSLVLVLSMVLGSFGFVFAAEEDNFSRLTENGILLGDTEGNLMLDQQLTRAQFAVFALRLKGFEDDAIKALDEEADFTDVAADAWYAPYVGLAAKEGLMSGMGDGTFAPEANVSYIQVLTVLLRTLGHDTKGLAWPMGYYSAAVGAGLVDTEMGLNLEVTREQMAEAMEVALDLPMLGEEVTLAQDLGIEEILVVESFVIAEDGKSVVFTMTDEEEVTVDFEFEANVEAEVAFTYEGKDFAEMITWEVNFLEVVSVTADNLKQVVVVFNQEVDADTVLDANFDLNKDKAATAMLQEDGKTVLLTLTTNLDNQVKYELTVDKVKNVAGDAMEKAEVEFTAFDRTLPEVEEIVVTGPRTFEITFSEPIETEGTITIKQDKTTLGNSVTILENSNVIRVQVFTNLRDAKLYTVGVTGFEDYAGYKNVVETLEFTYAEDDTPPLVTVLKAEQTYVAVEFNKPVKGLEAGDFYHTFNAWDAIGIFADADMENAIGTSDSVSKVFVQFWAADNDNSRAIPEGTTTLGILGAGIRDNWGNKLGNQTIEISVAVNLVQPEVTEIKVISEDKIEVAFNKNVEFANKNIEVLDEDGEEISGVTLNVLEAGIGKKFEVELGKNLSGEVILINITDVKDTSLVANSMPTHSQTLEITDKTKPVVEEVYYNLSAPDADDKFDVKELFIRFNESVDAETALVASNYSIVVGNNITILSGTPTFDGNDKRVRIPLTNAQAKIIHDTIVGGVAAADLQVINVKDIAGNTIVPRIVDMDTNLQADDFVKVTSVEATSTDTLVIKFNDLLTGVTPAAFTLMGSDSFTLTQSEEKGLTVVELVYSSKAFDTDAGNITFAVLTNEGLTNSFGVEITGWESPVPITATDKIDPAIVKYASDHATEAKQGKCKVERSDADTVLVYFTEAMTPGVLSTLTFSLNNADITAINLLSTDNSVVEITFALDTDKTVDDVTELTQSVKVVDANGNDFLTDKTLTVFTP
ncbi:MAG: S-layer homology domain-containing protein [Alkaliphilus sp.]